MSAACCAWRRSKKRAKREKGKITAAQRTEIEGREVGRIIRKQEEIGLKSAPDGEFRSWWHLDFLWGLDGVERYVTDQKNGVNPPDSPQGEPDSNHRSRSCERSLGCWRREMLDR
jgi:methionine synthase II (cobalamin-independent)